MPMCWIDYQPLWRTSSILAARHSFTILSSLADAKVLPSLENAMDLTRRRCPLKVIISSPVTAIPKLDGAVPARRGESATVRRKVNSIDDFRVALERGQ